MAVYYGNIQIVSLKNVLFPITVRCVGATGGGMAARQQGQQQWQGQPGSRDSSSSSSRGCSRS